MIIIIIFFCIYNVYYGYYLLEVQCVLYENTHHINAVDILKNTTGDVKQWLMNNCIFNKIIRIRFAIN